MDTDKPEQLVPIRLEFDVEHHKMRDTFVWNLNGMSTTWPTTFHILIFLRTFRPSRHPRKLCSDRSRGLQPLRELPRRDRQVHKRPAERLQGAFGVIRRRRQ
jgi:SNF5 / SMARCB1 / INI1